MTKYNFDSVLFEEWSKDFDMDAPTKIDNKLVHKSNDENVCISRIAQISAEKEQYLTQVAVDLKHPFFFDHPYDHIPGMLFVEVGRQVGTAVSHMFYDVPNSVVFVLKDIYFNFKNYAELDAPLFLSSAISDKIYRKDQLISMNHEGVFIQNGKELASMGGTWKIYDKKLMERMRNKNCK